MKPVVKTWLFDLYTRNGSTDWLPTRQRPMRTSSFLAFESTYTGGVNVATGWIAGGLGGFSRIIAGKQTGASTVTVFTSGSALTGHPALYLMPASNHSMMAEFTKAADFEAFPGSTTGVDVTTSANPLSADLVVSGVDDGKPTLQVFDLFRKAAKNRMLSVRPLNRTTTLGPIGAVGGR